MSTITRIPVRHEAGNWILDNSIYDVDYLLGRAGLAIIQHNDESPYLDTINNALDDLACIIKQCNKTACRWLDESTTSPHGIGYNPHQTDIERKIQYRDNALAEYRRIYALSSG